MSVKPPYYIEQFEQSIRGTLTEHVLVCGECGHPMCVATMGYVKCTNPECMQCNVLVYP